MGSGVIERRLVSTRTAECGCPEEVWEIGGLDVTIHFEEDETGPFADCFVFGDGWDVENRHAGSVDDARDAAFAWIDTWPHIARLAATLTQKGNTDE